MRKILTSDFYFRVNGKLEGRNSEYQSWTTQLAPIFQVKDGVVSQVEVKKDAKTIVGYGKTPSLAVKDWRKQYNKIK